MPRRKPGTLLPLEMEILHVALEMRKAEGGAFHGFALAHAMRTDGASGLVAHGTLYKALGRLEEMGMLTSKWEDPPPAGRPRRRLYEVTPAGAETAAATAPRPASAPPPIGRRLAPGTP